MQNNEWLDTYVLHRRPYRETSYIVDFFSLQSGRVSAVAKGVRNGKNDKKSVLQPFRLLRIQLSGRSELKNLRLAECVGPMSMLAGQALFCAMYLNELINRLLPTGVVSEPVYRQYQHALTQLNLAQSIEQTLREFEFALLDEMGLLADWFTDGITGDPIVADKWYLYSPEQGFVRCRQPNHKSRISGAALMLLGNGQWTDLSLGAAKRINRLALNHLLGGKPLKSRELFR
ncbi:DNA repair protein RecO [Alteromonas sp. C1M14]|uniref:DNA repair protein RecO n=1 Tax=Alteromonas sp. C1M14 TaxID=2841567 RepID=UPI001C090A54|nr:DNA repair protein RecO [Alteromonas sp. C1M14]MBU2977663.1 DNA repair protein RecO [Alteromonas sp. C1M14]